MNLPLLWVVPSRLNTCLTIDDEIWQKDNLYIDACLPQGAYLTMSFCKPILFPFPRSVFSLKRTPLIGSYWTLDLPSFRHVFLPKRAPIHWNVIMTHTNFFKIVLSIFSPYPPSKVQIYFSNLGASLHFLMHLWSIHTLYRNDLILDMLPWITIKILELYNLQYCTCLCIKTSSFSNVP